MGEKGNIYLCKYLNNNRPIQLIKIVYCDELPGIGKQLYFDPNNKKLLIRYFEMDGTGKNAYPMLIMQDTPLEYDLSETPFLNTYGIECDVKKIEHLLGNDLFIKSVFTKDEIKRLKEIKDNGIFGKTR